MPDLQPDRFAILERIIRTPFERWTRDDGAVIIGALTEYLAFVRMAGINTPLPRHTCKPS